MGELCPGTLIGGLKNANYLLVTHPVTRVSLPFILQVALLIHTCSQAKF